MISSGMQLYLSSASNYGPVIGGVLIGLGTSAIQSIGITLQRQSHIRESAKPTQEQTPPHRRPRWQLGMFLFISAILLGNAVQVSTLPLPILSTLQASSLVFNPIFATLMLFEPFTRMTSIGTLLICAGALLIALFGAIPSPVHTLPELISLLGRPPFVTWAIIQVAVIALICLLAEYINLLDRRQQSVLAPTHLQDTLPRRRFQYQHIRGFAFGCVSGISSAHTLLVTKAAVELLIKTFIEGQNQWYHWQAGMIPIAFLALGLFQLYFLHRGLQLVSTTLLCPFVFCCFNVTTILDGLIYYDQTQLLTISQALLILLGTVTLLTGVLALSWNLPGEEEVVHKIHQRRQSLVPESHAVDHDVEGPDGRWALSSSSAATLHYNTFHPTTSPALAHSGSEHAIHSLSPIQANERSEILDELHDSRYADRCTNYTNLLRQSTQETSPLLAGNDSHETSRYEPRMDISRFFDTSRIRAWARSLTYSKTVSVPPYSPSS